MGLSTRLAPTQWAYMLSHSGASLALGGDEFVDGLRAAGAEAGPPRRPGAGGRRPPHRASPARGGARTSPFPDEDRTYAVIYTSGTTGRPKASQVVHRGTMHSAIAYVRTLALTPGDRTAIVFPLYYVTGHVAQVTPMMLVGGTSVTRGRGRAPAVRPPDRSSAASPT